MKRTLYSRLLYSFTSVIIIVLLCVSVGSSLLIKNYFTKSKQNELSQKGQELSRVMNEYAEGQLSPDQLLNFLNSIDSFLDARVWLIDRSGKMLAMSTPRHGQGGGFGRMQGGMGPNLGNMCRVGGGMREMQTLIAEIGSVFEGNIWTRTFQHPYYNEEMLTVAVPLVKPDGSITGAVVLNSPVKGMNDFMRTIYYYIAGTGLLAILLTVVVVSYLARGIVRPLKAMQKSACAMAQGDYNTRVQVLSDDEVGDLGKSLNSLAKDLADFVSQTEKMEKMRRDFIANVSHEFRTPITIIRGYAEAFLDGAVANPETGLKYHRLMRDESVRLEKLIKDLLDLSHLQAERCALSKERISLSELARNVTSMFQYQAENKKIRLSSEIPESLPDIAANGGRLVQLLVILLDNALKYTDPGGQIAVKLWKENNNDILLSIADTGIGIPEEDLPYIWERFYKVDKSHSRLTDSGAGIGLAIAKQIIELHQAEVQVESTVGQGTTFTIRFPANLQIVNL